MYLLLIFGYGFTKINIIGSVYLYDLLLLLLFIFSLIKLNKIKGEKELLAFILLGFIYLAFSMYLGDGLIYVIRQYMIVGYLTLMFFIFQKIKHRANDIINFLLKISREAFILQLLYLLFILISGKTLFSDFNYLSPVAVMLIPVYAARILIYDKQGAIKILKIILVLIVSTMLGHSSAFLAVLVTIFGFFILKISPKQFLIALLIVIASVITLYFVLPQFRDVNANWRLFYWGIGIKNTFDTFLVLGNGFGAPFITNEQIQEMINVIGGSNDFLTTIDERYIKAYHNSFITIFFHMGLFTFLLSKPYIKGVKRLIFGEKSKSLNFLIISLLGTSIWVAFNVILELPHSSLIFWIVFLLTSNQLKNTYAT
jgi:hypothetical protein